MVLFPNTISAIVDQKSTRWRGFAWMEGEMGGEALDREYEFVAFGWSAPR